VAASFTDLPDLAATRSGGLALAASDEFFGPRENLLEPADPVEAPGRYTRRGKWMDGWETRRRRTPGSDWCLVRLGLPGIVRGVVVDTSFFRGNHPAACSLEGCALAEDAGAEEVLDPAVEWQPLLDSAPLAADSRNLLAVGSPYRLTHLRLHIVPDGGVARLRVHGEALPEPRRLGPPAQWVDLAALAHGARVVAASDRFFAPPDNLLAGGPAAGMGDGWETRRRRGPGHDWVVVRLAARGTVRRVEVDTTHFKGNHPDTCTLEVADVPAGDPAEGPAEGAWRQALARTRLAPHLRHLLDVTGGGPATHTRFSILPDGGVSRLRVLGPLDGSGWADVRLRHLNALLPAAAARELRRACGSGAWAAALAGRRPFAGLAELHAAADEVWAGLGTGDRLEAFAAHPRIGERTADRWAAREQAATGSAGAATLAALADANDAYERRFGHRFIVSASGRGGEELLDLLRRRLGNTPERELEIAAEEQRSITRLRLERLLEP
jgi:allantoicase